MYLNDSYYQAIYHTQRQELNDAPPGDDAPPDDDAPAEEPNKFELG